MSKASCKRQRKERTRMKLRTQHMWILKAGILTRTFFEDFMLYSRSERDRAFTQAMKILSGPNSPMVRLDQASPR